MGPRDPEFKHKTPDNESSSCVQKHTEDSESATVLLIKAEENRAVLEELTILQHLAGAEILHFTQMKQVSDQKTKTASPIKSQKQKNYKTNINQVYDPVDEWDPQTPEQS
ncbi:hypothetical protein CHARACLAT_021686 [Characodon lateralis]|uniref:Uncharacterized protein n=1 Tax=Characodon lateralis TaxID=208331 RepID=A0ABU7EBR6_9TELE|nr:hypothetical protein [Characodon lateralis]